MGEQDHQSPRPTTRQAVLEAIGALFFGAAAGMVIGQGLEKLKYRWAIVAAVIGCLLFSFLLGGLARKKDKA